MTVVNVKSFQKRITKRRRVTIPQEVLDSINADEGDIIEIFITKISTNMLIDVIREGRNNDKLDKLLNLLENKINKEASDNKRHIH